MNLPHDELVRFWELQWTVSSATHAYREFYYHWEQLFSAFEKLHLDYDDEYFPHVLEHYAPLEPEALVRFIDELHCNRAAATDKTPALEYLLRVVEPLREHTDSYGLLVNWERDDLATTGLDGLRSALVIGQPVLLLGSIEEVEQRDDGDYDVAFALCAVHNENRHLLPRYPVSLRAKEKVVNSLFEYSPTHSRSAWETFTIAVFAEIKSIEPCIGGDECYPVSSGILLGDLIEFYYSDLIRMNPHIAGDLVSLLSNQHDPCDFDL